MKFKLVLFLLSVSFLIKAQSFIKNTTNRPLTFKEIKKQFDDFKKQNKLSEKKHWKSLKNYIVLNNINYLVLAKVLL